MCNKRKNNQYKEALKIRNLVGLPLDHSITVQNCKLYENKLDVRIILIDSQESRIPLYPRNKDKKHLIYILKDSDHYHSIVSITGFYGTNRYCETCLKPYNDRNHNCASTCSVFQHGSCTIVEEVNCMDCIMVCRSEACFECHKSKTGRNPDTQKQQSLCEKFWRCNQCHNKLNRNKRKPEKHLCGEYNCPNCH